MKLMLLVLAMVTKVIAFEQIYAVNCGGLAHTDMDGITYQPKTKGHYYKTNWRFDVDTVPSSDKLIYSSYEYASNYSNPLIYHLPLRSDGLYVLIAKFRTFSKSVSTISMKLNDIHLISNVDQNHLCGENVKSCDKYFFICVSDNKLNHNNQSSLVKDNQIHVEFSANKGFVSVAGLVLLKGSIGERQKLQSSATKDTMYFNPFHTNSKCVAKYVQNSGIIDQSLKNISNMHAETVSSIKSSVHEANKHTLSEIQSIQKQQCKGSNNTNMNNIEFDNLKIKIDRAIEIGLTQQTDMKKIEADIKSIEADIKRIDIIALKVETAQANMNSQITDVTTKLDDILSFLSKSAENTRTINVSNYLMD
jgi:Malectin domain